MKKILFSLVIGMIMLLLSVGTIAADPVNVYITPKPAYDDDDLTCNIEGSTHPQDFYFEWYENEVIKFASYGYERVSHVYTDPQETWKCKVYFPGVGGPKYIGEDSVTILSENNPPYVRDPNPGDGDTNVPVDADLSWTGGDPDYGDVVTYDVYFEAGDSSPDVKVSSGQFETSYDPGTLDYDTRYYWKIVAEDNKGAVTEGEIWEFTTSSLITNPPNLDSISITPATPNENDDLRCSVEVSDQDGDLSYLRFRWYINNVLVKSPPNIYVSGSQDSGSDTLSSTYTRGGDSVKCEATVFDLEGNKDSDFETVTVQGINHAPEALNVYISPSFPKTNNDLTCEYTYYDQDGDLESGTEFRWFKNRVDQGINSKVLSSTYTSKGEKWYCKVKPKDGKIFGDEVSSNSVEILNSPPEYTTIPNQEWYENTDHQLNLNNYFSDPDGDSLSFTYTNLIYITISISNGIATLHPQTDWYGSEIVKFTASDGQVSTDSNWVTLTVLPLAENPIAVLTVSNTNPEVGENVRFDGSSSYDPDGYVTKYFFDFGDGQDSGWISNSYSYHSYALEGVYYAKLKVKDNENYESNWGETVEIHVSSLGGNPPDIHGIPDQYVNLGETINPIDLYSYASDMEDPDDLLYFSVESQSDTNVIYCYIENNRYLKCESSQNSGYSDITAKVTDTSGLSDTDTFRINVAQEGNNPPTIDSIEITPQNPTEYQDLECSVEVSDQDGDLDYVQFNWYVNNELKRQTNRNAYGDNDYVEDTLSSSYTNTNDYVKCEAKVYDFQGSYDSDYTSVHISFAFTNTPPISVYVEITPRHPNTQQDLTCSFAGEDVDDNLDYVYFEWLRNEEIVRTSVKDLEGSSDTASDTLDSGYTYPGDLIKCKATVYDTYGAYDSDTSLPVSIEEEVYGNLEPFAILVASPIYVETNEMVYFYGEGSYDLDGYVIQYYFDFGDGSTSLWSSSSEAYHSYSFEGIYQAKLKVKDNENYESDWSSPLTIYVSEPYHPPYYPTYFPRISYVRIEPWEPTMFDDLTCKVGVSDLDRDLEHVEFEWYIDDDLVKEETENIYGRYDTASSDLDSYYLYPGADVECVARVYDKEGNEDANHARVKIRDYPYYPYYPYYPCPHPCPPPTYEVCSVSIERFDYSSITLYGTRSWIEVEVENTGNVEGEVELKFFADSSFKGRQTDYLYPGDKVWKRFEVDLPLGEHELRLDAYLSCGSSVSRYAYTKVYEPGDGEVITPEEEEEEEEPREASVIIKPDQLDMLVCTGKSIVVEIYSPVKQTFEINITGIPKDWIRYPEQTNVKGSKIVYVYVSPDEIGNYEIHVSVKAEDFKKEKTIDLYVAPEEKIEEGYGLTGFITFAEGNWALGLVILIIFVLIVAYYVISSRSKKSESEEIYKGIYGMKI
jgi:hypothetical protein